ALFKEIVDFDTQKTKKILLIEHDKEESTHLCGLLGNEIFQTTTVSTVAQGITQLEKEVFDCILLNFDLPDAYKVPTHLNLHKQLQTVVILYSLKEFLPDDLIHFRRLTHATVVKTGDSNIRILD